jgi:hypothetical protein
MDSEQSKVPFKRKSTRFKPDPGTIAKIETSNQEGVFSFTLVGLVLSEAARGCSVVLVGENTIQLGEIWRIKVGELDYLKAEVKWITLIDQEIKKVGLMYLE